MKPVAAGNEIATHALSLTLPLTFDVRMVAVEPVQRLNRGLEIQGTLPRQMRRDEIAGQLGLAINRHALSDQVIEGQPQTPFAKRDLYALMPQTFAREP